MATLDTMMADLRKLVRNFWGRVQGGARRLFRRAGAPGVPDESPSLPPSGRIKIVDRAFAVLAGQDRASGGPASEATALLYDQVSMRLTDRFGPRSTALVPVLLASAEFEAGRGRRAEARNAAAAARSIMLAQWGRSHPLWPLVEARYNAISAPKQGYRGRR